MCNKDDLVSYLYDDLEGPARAVFERHVRECADCRDELTAMRAVRADLLTWSPPEPDFAFRLVSEPAAARAANVLRPQVPAWRAWFTPAAGFAAAAVLVLAAAAGLARVEIRSGPDGWTMRTGGSVPAADLALAGFGGLRARDVNLPATSGGDIMNTLERRISALEASSRGDASSLRAASVQSAHVSALNNEDVLKLVRELLAQSESRQKGELALRIGQLMRDVDMKRAADLNGVRQGIVRIDANMTEEAATHRELMNYIITNSKQK